MTSCFISVPLRCLEWHGWHRVVWIIDPVYVHGVPYCLLLLKGMSCNAHAFDADSPWQKPHDIVSPCRCTWLPLSSTRLPCYLVLPYVYDPQRLSLSICSQLGLKSARCLLPDLLAVVVSHLITQHVDMIVSLVWHEQAHHLTRNPQHEQRTSSTMETTRRCALKFESHDVFVYVT